MFDFIEFCLFFSFCLRWFFRYNLPYYGYQIIIRHYSHRQARTRWRGNCFRNFIASTYPHRICLTGNDEKTSSCRYRKCKDSKMSSRAYSFLLTTRTWENNYFHCHCSRDVSSDKAYQWASHRKAGWYHFSPDKPYRRRNSFYRWNTSFEATDRRDTLLSNGRFPDWYHDREWNGEYECKNGYSKIYPYRSYHEAFESLKSLRDRFGNVMKLDFYDVNELAKIIARSFQILLLESVNTDTILSIAERSRGTPRIANRYVKILRDYMTTGRKIESKNDCDAIFEWFWVDSAGLDILDRKLLEHLRDTFWGRPTWLSTIASVIGEEVATIEDVVEPYLLQIWLIERTPRGRQITKKGEEYLQVQ